MTFKNKANNSVKTSYHNLVVELAEDMADYLNDKYESDFSLLIRTHSQYRSWGGLDYISISDRHDSKPRKRVYEYIEYKSFCNDPVIGSVKGTSEVCISAVVAHELSHWIHHNLIKETGTPKKGDNAPHGKIWKSIYADLRQRFVNEFEQQAVA